jgi:hypothetical protein
MPVIRNSFMLSLMRESAHYIDVQMMLVQGNASIAIQVLNPKYL